MQKTQLGLIKWLNRLLLIVSAVLLLFSLRFFTLALTRLFGEGIGNLGQRLEERFDTVAWLGPLGIATGIGFAIYLRSFSIIKAISRKPRKDWPEGVREKKLSKMPGFLVKQGAVLSTALILLLAFLVHSWPLLNSTWITLAGNYDEGVNIGAARLLLEGQVAYRDYFFAHPPAAIYNYLPAALLGGGGPSSLWLGRFTAVCCAIIGAWLSFLAGRRLVNPLGGVIAAGVYAFDGIGVYLGRSALLEYPSNGWALGALVAFLKATDLEEKGQPWRKARLWYRLAGMLAAIAALTKLPGLLILVALVVYLLAQRAWRPAGALLAGWGVSTLVLALPYLVLSGPEMFRQVFFFQLLRLSDGFAFPDRINAYTILTGGAGYSDFTFMAAGLGIITCLAALGRGKKADQRFLIIALWMAAILFSFFSSPAFFPNYYLILAPVLALVTSLLGLLPGLIGPLRLWQKAATGLVIALLLVPAALHSSGQFGFVHLNPDLEQLRVSIEQAVPPRATIFTTFSTESLLSNRPLGHSTDGKTLLDPYGLVQYLDQGLDQKPLVSLLGEVLNGSHNRPRLKGTDLLTGSRSQLYLGQLANGPAFVVISHLRLEFLGEAEQAKLRQRASMALDTPGIKIYRNP